MAQQQNLEEMHLDELVQLAKEREIPHATEMRKSELIEALSKQGGERSSRSSREGGGGGGRDGGGGRESGSERGHEGTDGVKADWKQREQKR